MRNFWPKLRATLIAAALLLGAIDAIPQIAPGRAARLPVVLTKTLALVKTTQNAIIDHVGFLGRWFRVQQRWQLFPSADEQRHRMWIEARTSAQAQFQLLYRPHDEEHALFARELEYRRVRGNWNPGRRGARLGYDEFVSWIARRIFLRDPRWSSVRVRMEEILVLPRGKGFVGTGRFVHDRARERRDVLP